MNLVYTTDYGLLDTILSNPRLSKAILQDGDVAHINQDLEYLLASVEINQNQEMEVIGFFSCRPWTNRTIEAHIYVLPDYWGTLLSDAMFYALVAVLQKTATRKIITRTPAVCTHAINFVKRIGFKQAGCVSEAISWGGEVTDVLLWQYDDVLPEELSHG